MLSRLSKRHSNILKNQLTETTIPTKWIISWYCKNSSKLEIIGKRKPQSSMIEKKSHQKEANKYLHKSEKETILEKEKTVRMNTILETKGLVINLNKGLFKESLTERLVKKNNTSCTVIDEFDLKKEEENYSLKPQEEDAVQLNINLLELNITEVLTPIITLMKP
ncbi:12725_t:CDS:2 [Gigaspora margarita]|uniref:12725_t:CDS:1 n=1 Tax=Gigaspora margarita TaxID=4874 RepID=A0ABN7UWU4_GIGMA|nr:12725_t:CDS:2 [Gigaspora margarita]